MEKWFKALGSSSEGLVVAYSKRHTHKAFKDTEKFPIVCQCSRLEAEFFRHAEGIDPNADSFVIWQKPFLEL
jgi:predicted ATP-grasp superfamily ATP-dependent carboligase